MYDCYYGITPKKKHIFYVPHIIIGIGDGDNFNLDWDPETLRRISSLFRKKFISEDYFVRKGWNISRIEIPKCIIDRFRNRCFRSGKIRDDKKLEKLIADSANDILNRVKDALEYEDYEEDCDDEDYRENPRGYWGK